MKKEKGAVPKTPEHAVSNVRSFFTKEINDQISEMSTKEMESVMRESVSSRQFIALLKYTSMRMPLLDSSLRATNPYKDPHIISWTQGAMAGLCDIENYVIDLNAPQTASKEGEEEGEEGDSRPEGVIVG